MTKYQNGRFSVGAPSNDNYQKNYEDIFGVRKRDGDCPKCDGRGRISDSSAPGLKECTACEGTGRAAYAQPAPPPPTFDTTDG